MYHHFERLRSLGCKRKGAASYHMREEEALNETGGECF